MQTYIPEQSPILAPPCSIHVPASVVGTSAFLAEIPLPPTPRIPMVPLTPPNAITVMDHQPVADLYPLELLGVLTNAQLVALESIELISPVHVHTPTDHIGTLCGNSADQRVTALDVFIFLQLMAASPLDFHSIFHELSSDMKTHIKAAFDRRSILSPSAHDAAWTGFISGQYVTDGPSGIDLLFENSSVWGFESLSLTGYSVIHVADPNPISV